MTTRKPSLKLIAHRATSGRGPYEACALSEADEWSIFYKEDASDVYETHTDIRIGGCTIDEDPSAMLKAAIEDFPGMFHSLQVAWISEDGEPFLSKLGTPAKLLNEIVENAIDTAPDDDPDYIHPAADRLRKGLIEADQLEEGLGNDPLYLYSVTQMDSVDDSTWMIHATCAKHALNLYAEAIISESISTSFEDGPDVRIRVCELFSPAKGPGLIDWKELAVDFLDAAEIPLLKHAMAQGYEPTECAWVEPETETPEL